MVSINKIDLIVLFSLSCQYFNFSRYCISDSCIRGMHLFKYLNYLNQLLIKLMNVISFL